MRLFTDWRNLPPDARGAVVALGNFDGVHLGHAHLLRTAHGARPDAPLAVLTFEPHPRAFFNPAEPLFRLTNEATKLRLLAGTGLDGAIVLTFDAALASLTAEDFVDREATLLALGLEEFRRTGALHAEVEIKADRGATHGEALDKDALDKILRCQTS